MENKESHDLVYASWSEIVCHDRQGRIIGSTRAHDGDFYPLSVNDYVESIRRLREKKIRVPLQADIDITQQCNNNCSFCFSTYKNKGLYKNAFIDKRLFESLLEEFAAKGTKLVRFCGGGEPLMHPDINELIRLPSKYDLKLSVITNGDLMTNEIADTMLQYADKIHWSVNALTDETRKLLHHSQTGISQTIPFFRYIVANRIKSPVVNATFLLHPVNRHEIEGAIELLQDIGVDSISFRQINYHKSLWNYTSLNELNDQIDRAKKASHIRVYFPKAISRKGEKQFSRCLATYTRAVIEAYADGYLIQHCGMSRGKERIGDNYVEEGKTFEETWRHVRLSEEIDSQACGLCIDNSINVALNFINEMLDKDDQAVFSTR